MVTEVYDALIDAGASEAQARDAATALATYDSQFSAIRTDTSELRSAIKAEFADIRSDIKLLKRMNGMTWAMSMAVLLRLFVHA